MPVIELDVSLGALPPEEKEEDVSFKIKFTAPEYYWVTVRKFSEFDKLHELTRKDDRTDEKQFPYFPDNVYAQALQDGVDSNRALRSLANLTGSLQRWLAKVLHLTIKSRDAEILEESILLLKPVKKFVNGPQEWHELAKFFRPPRPIGVLQTTVVKQGMVGQIYMRSDGITRAKKFFQICSDGTCRVFVDTNADELLTCMELSEAQYERKSIRKYPNAIAITRGKRVWNLVFKRDMELQSWISYFSKMATKVTKSRKAEESITAEAIEKQFSKDGGDTTKAVSRYQELLKEVGNAKFRLQGVKARIASQEKSQQEALLDIDRETKELEHDLQETLTDRQESLKMCQNRLAKLKHERMEIVPQDEDEALPDVTKNESGNVKFTKEEKQLLAQRTHLHTHRIEHKHVHKHRNLKNFEPVEPFHEITRTYSRNWRDAEEAIRDLQIQQRPDGQDQRQDQEDEKEPLNVTVEIGAAEGGGRKARLSQEEHPETPRSRGHSVDPEDYGVGGVLLAVPEEGPGGRERDASMSIQEKMQVPANKRPPEVLL